MNNRKNKKPIILQAIAHAFDPSASDWRQFIYSMMEKATNNASLPTTIKLYQDLVKVYRPPIPNTPSKFHVIFQAPLPLIRAWAGSLQNGEYPDAQVTAKFLYQHPTLTAAKKSQIVEVFRQELPVAWYEKFLTAGEMYKNINYSLPCVGVHILIIDREARPRKTTYTLDGVRIPVTISAATEIPPEVQMELRSGLISERRFINGIRGYTPEHLDRVFVFAFDFKGTLIGAARCTRGRHKLYVNYLTSAKKCKGAGTYVMKAIEKYGASSVFASTGGRIHLEYAHNARNFYKKVGYNTNSNAENHMVKYFGPTRRGTKRKAPNST